MLSNEKYKGDALLQKTYTVDFLIKKKVVNTGQIPRYYVEESHPAIIDKDMWEAVQLEMERRRAFAEKHGIIKVDYDRQIIYHLLIKRILSVGGFYIA
jgi:site-specific DNA recombinase